MRAMRAVALNRTFNKYICSANGGFSTHCSECRNRVFTWRAYSKAGRSKANAVCSWSSPVRRRATCSLERTAVPPSACPKNRRSFISYDWIIGLPKTLWKSAIHLPNSEDGSPPSQE